MTPLDMKTPPEIWDTLSQTFLDRVMDEYIKEGVRNNICCKPSLDAMKCCDWCRRMTAGDDICVQKDCPCHIEAKESCQHHGTADWIQGFGWKCNICGGWSGNHGGTPGSSASNVVGSTGGGGGVKESWEKRVKDRFHELTDNEQISVNVMASVLMLVGEEIVCALEEGRKKERDEVIETIKRMKGEMLHFDTLTDLLGHLQEKNNN